MNRNPHQIATSLILAGLSLWSYPGLAQDAAASNPSDPQTNANAQAAEDIAPLPPLSPNELAPPAALVNLLNDEEVAQQEQRAGVTAEQFLADVALPDAIAEPKKLASPPLAQAIVRMLDAAESAVAEGRYYDAIQAMQKAQRLAPNHPQVLQQFGLTYAASGNDVRAEQYLLAVVRHDPTKLEAVLLLTRAAMAREDHARAMSWIRALDHAAKASNSDDAEMLAKYFRAELLARAGYRRAAAERFREVLKYEPKQDGGSAVAREWYVIDRRASALWLQLGDLELIDGDVQAAGEAYAKVDVQVLGPSEHLIARKIYIDLLMRDSATALDRVAEALSKPAGTTDDAALVEYLLKAGVQPDVIRQKLNASLRDGSATLALLGGLARVIPPDEMAEQVSFYLDARPVDAAKLKFVFPMLGLGETKDPQQVALAARLAAEVISRRPDQASQISGIFLDQKPDPVTLIRAMKSLDFEQAEVPWQRYMAGRSYAAMDRDDLAGPILAEALVHLPEASAIRLALATLLYEEAIQVDYTRIGDNWERDNQVDSVKLREAKKTLSDIEAASDWPSFKLLVNIHQQLRESQKVKDLLSQRAMQLGLDTQLRVFQALKLHETGQQNLLTSLIQLNGLIAERPEYEPAYEAAFELFLSSDEEFTRQTLQLRGQIIQKLVRNLPDSRLALSTQFYDIWFENKTDPRIGPLLERMIEINPNDTIMLSHLAQYHTAREEFELANKARIQLIESQPPGAARRAALAKFYSDQGEGERALALVKQTLAEEKEGVLPGPALDGSMAAALLAPLAVFENEESVDPLYLSMLRRFPDNAMLNNSIAYRWSLQGKNLNHAKAMIQRAIDVGGENSAYLDTMAWVLYKRGEFAEAKAYQDQALKMLRDEELSRGVQLRASKAILSDHMGDILYRLDDQHSATRHWQVARALRLSDEEMASDPELASLSERVNAKITAVRNDEDPPLDPIIAPEDFGPAGHPADKLGKTLEAVPKRPEREDQNELPFFNIR